LLVGIVRVDDRIQPCIDSPHRRFNDLGDPRCIDGVRGRSANMVRTIVRSFFVLDVR
jgi:hypothetical protein